MYPVRREKLGGLEDEGELLPEQVGSGGIGGRRLRRKPKGLKLSGLKGAESVCSPAAAHRAAPPRAQARFIPRVNPRSFFVARALCRTLGPPCWGGFDGGGHSPRREGGRSLAWEVVGFPGIRGPQCLPTHTSVSSLLSPVREGLLDPGSGPGNSALPAYSCPPES